MENKSWNIDKFSYENLKKDKKFHKELEDFFDTLSDGIVITDKNGIILIYNREKEIQENRDRKEMIGKYIWDAYDYSLEEKSEHQAVYKSEKPIINEYSAHSVVDGIPRYINYSTYPLKIRGKTVGAYSVSKNETSLHQSLVDTIKQRREFNRKSDKNLPTEYYENGTRYTFSNIVGDSEGMKNVIRMAQNIAFLDNSVLIIGETGTGKEVLAQSIHNFSDRESEPFIGLNCSAIPENLLESMLFGTEKGAYTGAVDSKGLFEKAGRGTIFLDDINTMAIPLQAKLLRALQERKVTRVGSSKSYDINCRILSATNEDPFSLINEGKLREDLYYRIAGFSIRIPPLRSRKEDIILLVEYFIRRYNHLLEKSAIGVDPVLKKVLDDYKWPGNIRELENLVENMLVNADSDEKYLTVEDIPPYLKERFNAPEYEEYQEVELKNKSYNKIVDNFERKILFRALEDRDWNISKTARDLDLNRNSLIYKMDRLKLTKN